MCDETDRSVVMIWSTWPDAETAGACARTLVERRLVACVTLQPGIRSVYRWQGAVEEASEAMMWAKTRTARAEEVIAAIVASHPYDVPAVLALPVTAAHPAYAAWIAEETTPEEKP